MIRFARFRGDFWIVVGLFVLVCGVFGRFLFTNEYLIYNSDINYFYPHERVIRHSLELDEFPLWNAYFGGGSPQLSKIQAGLLYPPAILLRTFLPIVPMFNWEVIIHLFLAGLGMYVLLRSLGVNRSAAALAGVAFMFSGSVMPRVAVGHASILRTIVWIGWLLWAYRRLLINRSWWNLLLTILFVVLVILGGHPQLAVTVLFVPLSFFLFVFLPERIRTKDYRGLGQGLLYSVLAVLGAVGLTAVQLVPFLEWLRQTTRGQGAAIETFEFMTRNSLNVEFLLNILFPYLWYDPVAQETFHFTGVSNFRETSPFLGVTLLTFLLFGFLLRKGERKKLTFYLVGLAVFGLVMSMGKINPVYRWFFSELPVFRAPGRFVILWVFSMAVLAGLYGHEVVETVAAAAERFRLKRMAYLAFVGFLLGVIATVLWTLFGGSVASGWLVGNGRWVDIVSFNFQRGFITVTVILLLVAALMWNGRRERVNVRRWQWLAFFIVAAEMGVFVSPLVNSYPLTDLYRADHPLAQLAPEAGAVRIVGYREPPNYLVPTLVHVSNGEEHFALVSLVENLPQGLYLLSAGFLATAEPVDEPHLELVQQTDSAYLYEAQGNLPRIYVASGVEVVDSHEAALAAATVAASAPYTQAVVTVLESDEMGEGEIAVRGPAGQAAEFTAEYSAYETNSLTAEVTTERAGIVVFSEMYYPGWEAVVDGQPARVWRANYAFRGVMVEAGTHVIRMDYRPASFRIGLVISGVTLLVIAGISAVKGAGFLVRRR